MNSTQSTSSAAVSSSRRMFTTRELVIGGMFAALLAVISQLSIPMPSGVPITIQILGVALVGSVLGWRTFRHHHLYSDRRCRPSGFCKLQRRLQ